MRRAGGRGAKPRTAPMARRRDGDIAPYRNGTRARRGTRNGTRGGRGGAMGTSRPTAMGHERCARRGERARGAGCKDAHGDGFSSSNTPCGFLSAAGTHFLPHDTKKREDGRPLFGIAYEAQQSPKCGDRRYRVNQGNSVLFLQQLDGRRTRLRHDCDPIGFQQLSIHVGCGNQPLTRELEIGNIHF